MITTAKIHVFPEETIFSGALLSPEKRYR